MYVLGVDMGTTSTKAVLFDRDGRACGSHYEEYPLHATAAGAAEQDPDRIVEAALSAIASTIRNNDAVGKVAAVCFSAAHHGMMALDADGVPLTRLQTWADTRSVRQMETIRNASDAMTLYQATGTPLHPMSLVGKIAWLREEKPEIFEKTAMIAAAKEYLLFRLFGKWVIDHSVASATGLLNIHTRTWDTLALRKAGITAERLPEPVPTDHVLSGLVPSMAERLGLDADTPFVTGAGDAALSNLGLNAIDPGVVAVSIGTSGAVRMMTPSAQPEPKGRLFCYVVDESRWIIGGAASSGGVSLRWIRDQLCDADIAEAERRGCDPYEIVCERAASVTPGADGLLFLPYLSGERAPLWDASARGSFIGLTLSHTKNHMVRAAMEGILFNLRGILTLVEKLMGPSVKIQASGGFARSPLWCQMMADVFNRPVFIPVSFESPCLGAAVMAMRRIGWIDDIHAVDAFVGAGVEYRPDPDAAQVYDRMFPLFDDLSHKLLPGNAALRRLQDEASA